MTPTATATHSIKVVVAGSFAVGKSTLIRAISDTEVVGTEASTSGAEAEVKDTTTVGMEYGTFAVGDGEEVVELLLHGLPGQERFRFMWDIVSEGADGFLLLVDGSRPDTWDETLAMADHLRSHSAVPLLVGVNRAEGDAVAAVAEALSVPLQECIPCEVIDRSSAREAMVELLLLILDSLEAPPPDPTDPT